MGPTSSNKYIKVPLGLCIKKLYAKALKGRFILARGIAPST